MNNMKKIRKVFALALCAIAVFLAVSCEKNESIVGKWDLKSIGIKVYNAGDSDTVYTENREGTWEFLPNGILNWPHNTLPQVYYAIYNDTLYIDNKPIEEDERGGLSTRYVIETLTDSKLRISITAKLVDSEGNRHGDAYTYYIFTR